MTFYSRLVAVALTAAVSTTFVACSGGKGKVNMRKPESVAKAFVTSLNQLDYEQCKKLGTASTGEVVDLLQMIVNMTSEEEQKNLKTEMAKQVAKDFKCTLKGDNADCTYCCDEAGQTQGPLTLVKQDGKWLVNLNKEDLMGEGEEEEDSEEDGAEEGR